MILFGSNKDVFSGHSKAKLYDIEQKHINNTQRPKEEGDL